MTGSEVIQTLGPQNSQDQVFYCKQPTFTQIKPDLDDKLSAQVYLPPIFGNSTLGYVN